MSKEVRESTWVFAHNVIKFFFEIVFFFSARKRSVTLVSQYGIQSVTINILVKCPSPSKEICEENFIMLKWYAPKKGCFETYTMKYLLIQGNKL